MSRLRTRRAVSIAWIVLVSGGAYLLLELRLDSSRAEQVSVTPIDRHEQLRSSRPARALGRITRAAATKAKAAPTIVSTTATSTTTLPKPAPTVVAPPPRPAPPPQPPIPPLPPPSTPSAFCMHAVASVAWPPAWRASCEASRAGLLGLTSPAGTSQIFTRPQLSPGEYLLIALHEAGNAWNFARLTSSDRVTWCAARGCDAGAFFAGPVHAGGWIDARGAEDWAEAWQACHGVAYDRSYLGLGPPTAPLCTLQRTLVAR